MKAIMIVKRDTKGAILYKEVKPDGTDFTIADGAPIGEMYVRKSAFGGRIPPKITVSIEE